ncbi:hypothetical protein BJ138DRAFT_1098802 [Hygrophoropsis aurantiaca]|uniref:Uncharacterized protein n=1 Tax=Hygrophoropsis aurantiaca TaxID=72124 RepID=A0ACB8AM86_9AGAM|nr:hypothetical protein BJ138DRAFT_1098802 [Hygrophoropsis aurantiaca]
MVETQWNGNQLASSNPRGKAIPSQATRSHHTRAYSSFKSDSEIQEVAPPKMAKKPPRPSHPIINTEPITIPDSDEDTGVVMRRERKLSSPDPMLLTDADKTTLVEVHDFQTMPGQSSSNMNGKGKRKLSPLPYSVDGEEISSPIDEPSKPPSHSTIVRSPKVGLVKEGHVKETRKKFEEAIPHLNFKDMAKNQAGVSARMKSKSQSKPPSTTSEQLDPIATSSSGFKSQDTRSKMAKYKLPLRAWSFGCKLYSADDDSSQLFFEYFPGNRPKITISSTTPRYTISFQPDRDAGRVTITNDLEESLKAPVIQFSETYIDTKAYKHLHEGSYASGWVHRFGSTRPNGQLTFLFSISETKGWTATAYQEMVESLKTKCFGANNAKNKHESTKHETIRPSAGEAIWQRTKDVALFDKRQKSRTSEVTEESTASPEPELNISGPLRRSARTSAAKSNKPSPSSEPDELILVYPPTGTGALNIMRTDLNRLQPGEFLNDTLIEFGLKLWLSELRENNPTLADQIHVFSSFFYKKLHNKKSQDEGYQSVRKWTSKFDLFSKKYIIVPINENLHWYLAIIYEPEYILLPRIYHQPSSSVSTRGKKRQMQAEEKADPNPANDQPPDISEDVNGDLKEFSRSRLSDMPQGGTMEDAFGQSCSISDVEKPRSHSIKPNSSASASGKANFEKPLSVASSKTADRESPMLEYPSDRMDVDNVDTDPPHNPDPSSGDIEMIESKPSFDVDAISPHVESPSFSLLPNGVSSTNLYGSSSSTKGKQKAEDPEIVSDSEDDGSDQKRDEIKVIEREPSLEVDAIAPPVENRPSPSLRNGVPPTRFYGSSPIKKGKRKAEEPLTISDSEDNTSDHKQEKEVDDMLTVPDASQGNFPVTHIFTLDSLGGRHPQAIKVLKHYLKMEAKDKKNLEPDCTRAAAYKQALVPTQPNYCDCGVYLLHFVETFMSNPTRFSNLIRSKKTSAHDERKAEWNEEVIPRFRENLISRIENLSDAWKADKAAKEEELKKKKAAAGDDPNKGSEDPESSEGEVDIVEDLRQEKPTNPSPKGKPRTRTRAKPAVRLRG